MRDSNGKLCKTFIVAMIFYLIMLCDLMINTLIAHIFYNGAAAIEPAIMIGPIVYNPISIPVTFSIATFLLFATFVSKLIYGKRRLR